MPIVGTAGHVDHGKSALVEALTGTHPDRWLEERLRGMTLDLGFAHLVLDDGIEAGIIDVPGHERFLHNMLAGAAGIDVLLLVVAANEGVMPQTLEHLEVLRFLNVGQTIVVVTKIDLVASDARASALGAVAGGLQGTPAAGAPLIAVSSVTGEGLDRLRSLVAAALRALPQPAIGAPVYLPIDRAFSLPGRGTIVTGTLMQGTVAIGDVLGLEPAGKSVRARSVHVFGRPQARVGAGSRVALNLAGIDRQEIGRGDVVVSPEFAARSSFDVRFTPRHEALPLLRRRTPVRAYVGSAEILGRLLFETVPATIGEWRAQLHLDRPAVAFPGVRFVVRRPSPKTLLGGGRIEGADPLPDAEEPSPLEAAVLGALHACGLAAVELGEIALAANVREEAAREALEALAERDGVLVVRRPTAYVAQAPANDLLRRALEYLEEAQAREPWAMGATSMSLARALTVGEPLLVSVLTRFVENGRLGGRAGYYATLDHRPSLNVEQSRLFDALVALDEARPFVPTPFAAALAAVRRSDVPGAARAFDTLLASGTLVKVGGDLYRGSQIGAIRARVESYLRQNDVMTAADFRDLLGTSRKYAVPLLEWLDARGVTVRNGDYRTLRKSAG